MQEPSPFPRKSRQVTGSRGHQPGLPSVRPPQPKIDQLLAGCGKHHPCRLGSDKGLKVEDVDKAGFDQLRFRKRRGHPDDRFVSEENATFRHGIDIASKAQAREVIEKPIRKPIVLPEPIDVFVRELQVLKKVEGLLQSSRHEEASASWKPTHEELEYSRIHLTMVQVRLKHVQLIQISQQRACRRIHVASPL